jgi:hypothetical protein
VKGLIPKEKVIAMVRLWQTRLRLNHWDVRVEVVEPKEIDGKIGQVTTNFMYVDAHMLLTNHDHLGLPHDKKYMTEIVVHELMHIHLCGMKVNRNTPEEVAEEQAVCILTKSFCEAYDWK